MAADPLQYLQEWYRAQCDEDWEHEFGVKIYTLDNPGWRLVVDIDDTELEDKRLERQITERSEHDWWQAWCDGSQFNAAAGPGNLGDAIEAFRSFVEANTESS